MTMPALFISGTGRPVPSGAAGVGITVTFPMSDVFLLTTPSGGAIFASLRQLAERR
ncbi:hypothetical protein [Niveispirillum sp.]|uniref:hypothetical protein n=1 Tax=Niveispirillum sp. TaxID=1917217 RepID=UPI001B48761B|nr:hypothetical protein [Niveispirillum sp.]MBP7335834.1 hypothetical protein [Niveispirillum sp.]